MEIYTLVVKRLLTFVTKLQTKSPAKMLFKNYSLKSHLVMKSAKAVTLVS